MLIQTGFAKHGDTLHQCTGGGVKQAEVDS
jgi:hypothetical protein